MGRAVAHRLEPGRRPDEPGRAARRVPSAVRQPDVGVRRRTRRAEMRQHNAAWQFSQFLHGEQGAMVCAAKIVESSPTWTRSSTPPPRPWTRPGTSRRSRGSCRRRSAWSTRSTRTCTALLDDTLRDSRWDMPYLGMQVLIEGLALAAFGVLRDMAPEAAGQAAAGLRHAGRGPARRLRPDRAEGLLRRADRRRTRRARGVRRRGLLPDARPVPRRGGLRDARPRRRGVRRVGGALAADDPVPLAPVQPHRADRQGHRAVGRRRCRRRSPTWACSRWPASTSTR